MLYLKVDLSMEAEKLITVALGAHANNPHGKEMLRDLCIALCPQLDPAMQQAVAAVAKATLERTIGAPAAYPTMPKLPPAAVAACYNCGRWACCCPTGLVPQ